MNGFFHFRDGLVNLALGGGVPGERWARRRHTSRGYAASSMARIRLAGRMSVQLAST